MTKSNLKTHLKWLLDQGPSLYTVLTPPAWETHVKPNDSHINSSPELNLIDSQTEDLNIKDSQPAFETAINHVNDGFEVDSDTDMARLMLAPPSASKPRMLSCTQESPGSVRKTPRIGTLPQSPPEREAGQTPRSKKVKESSAVPFSFRDLKERITTPVRPKRKLDVPSSITDIDTIDLTGDFDRTKPSSVTGEEFDEPRRLWTEDAASKKEPADKRGKKRKSDEYTSDLLSPGDHDRRTRSPLIPDKHLQSDQNISTHISRLASKDELPPSRKKKQTHSSTKRASKTIAIPDSDDESVDGLFEGLIETNHSPRIRDKSLYPVLPVEKHSNTPVLSPALKQRESISPDSIDMPKITDPTPMSGSNTTPNSSRSLPPPPSSAAKPSTQPIDKNVEKFLQMPSDSLSRLTAHMRSTIQKNSAIVYDKSMNGEYAPELVSENGNIQIQIRAIENLNTQKSIYLSREAESESLKGAIMQGIGQGIDPATLPQFEQQIKITSQMKEIQSDLGRLLQEINLFSTLDKYSLETPASDPEELETLSCTTSVTNLRDHGDTHLTKSPVARGSFAKHSLAPPACGAKGSHLATSKPGTNSVSNGFKNAPRPAQFDYDEPVVSDDETTFTRTMGSPLPPINDMDEFDMDVFDEDMLEVVDYLQNDRLSSTERHGPHRRPVFTETSGNATRLPGAQKSQTHSTIWGQHPWTKDVKSALKERFHLRGFRLNQLEAIDSTLSGKDTFVLMPTGGGKSLCYQLPSVVSTGSTKGVTIVISPLLSLMQDQVSHLRRNKIKAYLVNGETPREERQWIMSTLSSSAPEKQIELLYITPEMISKSHAITDCLEDLNAKQRLARIVIDEAHCVSQWGHDFRPDYKELGRFRARIPGVPMMALTATATENVKVDVIHNLKMDGCDVFTQSFNRPNLTYEVRRKGKKAELLESIAETITGSYRNKSGIVYCLARNTCEQVAEGLRKNYRIKAAHYHAGLNAEERAQAQQKWQTGEIHVIVATIAFGMGIDKPDVRFVIHHSIPKSLEGYYQETGRAGRDGRRSGCYLYFGRQDINTIERMIDKNQDASHVQKTRQLKMLRNVAQYCENQNDCRRVQILAYFSESFQRQDCNASCDNCKSGATFEVRDFSEHAAAAVKIVRYFQDRSEKVTLSYCVNILRGTTKSFRSPEHRHAPCFGDGADIELGDAERLFRKLLGEKALKEENIMNQKSFPIQYIKLGFRAADFESGRRRLRLDVRLPLNGNPRQRDDAGRDDLPQSTNVSSPVQSANRRRLARYRHTDTVEDDCDSDGFERIRVAGKNERKGKNLPGPPITQDHRYDQLDPLHKTVAEDFMVYAKKYCQDVVIQKGLRNQPFTDTILREMVMIFPQGKSEWGTEWSSFSIIADAQADKSAMLQIPDIDPDKVHRYGDKILKLVRDTQRRYTELKKERDDVDGVIPDPNHHNVVNISSDDEFSDFDDDLMDQATTLQPDDSVVTSQYFPRAQQPFEDDSGDDYRPSPKASSSKPQKRKTTKRTRRKSTDPKTRSKGQRNQKTNHRSQGRSFAPKESKAKPKQPRSQIAMMPI